MLVAFLTFYCALVIVVAADVSVISKFGENEFKSGDKERGRTYFESVLENAVRRVDVWSVYLDMEIKYGDEDRTECVFARALPFTLDTHMVRHIAFASRRKRLPC